MNENDEIFIKILSAYINDKSISPNVETDWDSIYHLASIHSVSAIIMAVIKNNKLVIPQNVNNKFQNDFLSTLMISIKQEKESEKLLNILNTFKINHYMTKGYIMRNYYKDKELRTMGDVDILVQEKDFDETAKILKDNGYIIIDTYFKEIGFNKNNIHFELHSKLLEENLGNDFDYGTYFDDLCKNAKIINNHTYELSTNDHLIYLIAHIGKHFYNEGCGIRMIMDIAIYLNKFSHELNWEYLWKEFEKIKLKKFAENIFYICNKWFETKINTSEMDNELYIEVKKYILEAGTFGFYERNSGTKLLRKSYGSGKQGNIISWFFPSDKDMRELSEWYKEKSKIFLPIAWIKRWFSSLKKKKIDTLKKTISVLTDKQASEKQYNLLKKLGIYQSYSVSREKDTY